MSQNKVEVYDAATQLKQIYGVNKNISKHLSAHQKEELLSLLENNNTVLAFGQAMIAKNNELSNNNRKFGRQRENAKRDLQDQKEINNELNTEVSQLKYELKALKKQLINIVNGFHGMLMEDMLNRSEILLFVESLLNTLQNNNQEK